MIIVVDGYNVLKQVSTGRQITESQRNAFIMQLGKYGRIKNHEIIVVFDGGPSDWVYKERIAGVLVVYPGPSQTADDYIKEYVAKRKTDDILLVSNDRELKQSAGQFSIPSLEAVYFYRLVQGTLQEIAADHKKPGGLVKLTQEENSELDELMKEASKKIVVKREDIAPSEIRTRQSAAHTLSKEERKVQKKLKKL